MWISFYVGVQKSYPSISRFCSEEDISKFRMPKVDGWLLTSQLKASAWTQCLVLRWRIWEKYLSFCQGWPELLPNKPSKHNDPPNRSLSHKHTVRQRLRDTTRLGIWVTLLLVKQILASTKNHPYCPKAEPCCKRLLRLRRFLFQDFPCRSCEVQRLIGSPSCLVLWCRAFCGVQISTSD